MRRDREDELDLAHVGGETGTATHGANITPPRPRPKRSGQFTASSAHDDIDLPAAASRADPPLALIEDRDARCPRCQTINRSSAVATLPSVIGGLGSDFIAALHVNPILKR
jgi:hypothetical protein